MYIPRSLIDPRWCKDIEYAENGVFMIAGGVLPHCDATQVQQFFSMLSDNFPGGEIVFDAFLKLENDVLSWTDLVSPGQRDTLRAMVEEALNDWWGTAPLDQKDKLNEMIAMLKIPAKPKGKEWPDIKSWWNQLSNKEREEVLATLFRGVMVFGHQKMQMKSQGWIAASP